MLQDLPGSQFTEEKRKGNKVLSISFKIGDNCSKPCYPEAESALDRCVQPQASQQGYIIMQAKSSFFPPLYNSIDSAPPKPENSVGLGKHPALLHSQWNQVSLNLAESTHMLGGEWLELL